MEIKNSIGPAEDDAQNDESYISISRRDLETKDPLDDGESDDQAGRSDEMAREVSRCSVD